MGKWKKASSELVEYFDESFGGYEAERRKMFGYPVYFVNGNMFAGVHEENIILKLREEDRKNLLTEDDEIRLFEPMKGKVMKEYVCLPPSVYDNQQRLFELGRSSYEYVRRLPPKKKKK